MISAGISKLGKTSIHFVEPRVKINSRYYCNTLLEGLLEEMDQLSNGDYVFQQDGARSHTSEYSLAYLKRNVPELLEPHFWPTNSCDLNHLDYGIWGIMQQRVYRERINTVDELKDRILQVWNNLTQDSVDRCLDAFRKSLHAVIPAKGGHIEHFV